jgi:hypothetical protein
MEKAVKWRIVGGLGEILVWKVMAATNAAG